MNNLPNQKRFSILNKICINPSCRNMYVIGVQTLCKSDGTYAGTAKKETIYSPELLNRVRRMTTNLSVVNIAKLIIISLLRAFPCLKVCLILSIIFIFCSSIKKTPIKNGQTNYNCLFFFQYNIKMIPKSIPPK